MNKELDVLSVKAERGLPPVSVRTREREREREIERERERVFVYPACWNIHSTNSENIQVVDTAIVIEHVLYLKSI